jgi:hypothetical protein
MRRKGIILSDTETGNLSVAVFQTLLASELKSFRLEIRFYIFTLSVLLLAHISGFTIPIKEVLGVVHI